MISNHHEPGTIREAGEAYLLRNEQNGLTVYDRREHLYYFYEGVCIGDLAGGTVPPEPYIRRFMAENKDRLTKNVRSDSPFSICWLISGNCNLDCVYCFAEDKMRAEAAAAPDEMATARHLLSLNPLSISLTGGEPTLNPRLEEVLRFFRGKAGTVLDTNGTTPQLEKLIPALKEAGTAVRLTVDILDDAILNRVRPRRGAGSRGAEGTAVPQCEILRRNIRALTEAGIPTVIHTVLTRYNIGRLDATAEELAGMGVKRWHFYAVNYSEKCSAFYDSIKVSRQEACAYTDTLIERYGERLKITCPRNDIGNRERAVLMVDSRGRFLVDTIYSGCLSLGKNPCFPEKEEVLAGLDFELHKQAYLCNYWE